MALTRFVHGFLLIALMGSIGACGYVPIKPGAYIETKGPWALRSYVQEGQSVGIASVLSEVRKYEGSALSGKKAETLFWLAHLPSGG
ncbi:MAG: hypothetical protein K2X47_07860 [Bdellovibrionales bacterium]|nr:hypothetical protein [Bdellovibrionales bacterium]